MDDPAYQFTKALLLARQVDRDIAALIVQDAKAGAISLEQATRALQGMVSADKEPQKPPKTVCFWT